MDLLVPGSMHWEIQTTFSAATLALELRSDRYSKCEYNIHVVQVVDAIRDTGILSHHGHLESNGRGLGNWYN